MLYHVPEQYHQDHRSLQAFTSLLTLVEAVATITEQGEHASRGEAENAPPITLAAAGKSFAEIAQQVLDCKYVGVFALDPPNMRQRLLGTSGLSPKEEARLHRDTDQTPLADYISELAIVQLRNDQIVTLDLQKQPFVTARSTHGARFRLVAPMVRHGQLIGLFTMAKTDEGYHDVASAYTPQDKALAKG